MMEFPVFLQIWAGGFYLLNKIFFSRKERSLSKIEFKKWQTRSWAVYLIGLPAWVIIFVLERNWIAAALEAGGAPSMILGLIIAIRGKDGEIKWLRYIALAALILGLGYSLYDFGGITTPNQFLELGIVTGYLIGTYMLAREDPKGYIWFLFMILSCGSLMALQEYWWLMGQQIVSFFFVFDAYRINKRKQKIVFAKI
jgi:hypothetical protein